MGGGTPPYTYALKVDATALPTLGPTSATTASQSWDTRTVANGAHTLTLTLTDNSGATKTVMVSNTATAAPLSVAITSPKTNATVTPDASGNVWVVVWLTGTDQGTPGYSYKLSVDGQQVWTQSSSSTGPVSMPWPTGTRPSGPATLTVTVTDAAGRSGSASVSITLQR